MYELVLSGRYIVLELVLELVLSGRYIALEIVLELVLSGRYIALVEYEVVQSLWF